MADTEPIVLVADDEPATLKYLSMNLRARGYQVLTASDGNEAMQIFRRRVVDLAMLDVTMPGIDGFEVCRQIRTLSNIPVIMLTARAREADVVEAFDCGADAYVTKPFGVKELLARVRSAIRRSTGKAGPEPEPAEAVCAWCSPLRCREKCVCGGLLWCLNLKTLLAHAKS